MGCTAVGGDCGAGEGCAQAAVSPALRDTVASLFDSLVAIHQAIPDTALLARMHPAADTLQFVEGAMVHHFTGDSLRRRVTAAHADVSSMGPEIVDRRVLLLDSDHAVLTGTERVSWIAAGSSHHWEGLITVVAARRGARWVLRGYRH
jgi:hypothetical protein